MKYSDLKDNWVVMLRDGKFGIVSLSCIETIGISVKGTFWGSYSSEMLHINFCELDIMKVWSTDNGEMTLVYERKEPTEKERAMKRIAELKQEVAELEKSVEGMK